MNLDLRDRAIVELISKFNQLSSSQIHAIIFNNSNSHTPTDRVLGRLVDQRYLARVEGRRVVGGSRGGSGQYVYTLGTEGHRIYREGRYSKPTAINYHSLAIAGCFAALVDLEREGYLLTGGYSTEPDCHVTIGRYELKPDFYVELSRTDGAHQLRLMIEVDMSTQGQRQIMAKFERYWGARQAADEREWPANQIVVFLAVHDQRADELRWLRQRLTREQQELFKVWTLAELCTALSPKPVDN